MASFMGLSSIFGALGFLSQSYVGSSLKLLVLGSLIETGRRFCSWLIERFRLQYLITAQFNEGDPAYEWIVLFITQERVWKRSRDFVVSANNSQRKWAVSTAGDPTIKGHVEYVPTYQIPQLFKWSGYWLEIKRGNDRGAVNGGQQTARIYVTIYTLDMDVLSRLVEEARRGQPPACSNPSDRFGMSIEIGLVIWTSASHLRQRRFNPHQVWNSVKRKIRRPLSSIILPPGLLDSLVEDAQEFLNAEDWYVGAGIPHRRGYLLHGPPGTGKTSTIYALAGALNLEIYSLSLASNNVDNGFLQQAASSIPKNGIFLIEDIDCAFPSREDEEDELPSAATEPMMRGNMNLMRATRPQRLVTLSRLLRRGSSSSRRFTNYIDRLDAALLRPGRIDRKIEYALSTTEQTRALFARFFPAARFPDLAGADSQSESASEKETLVGLAAQFAADVPPHEFSTAELQGFLQGYKTRPVEAAQGVAAWVEDERRTREERAAREEQRRKKTQMRMQNPMGGEFGGGMRYPGPVARERPDGGGVGVSIPV
ncbi:P-loop containing nucleoside triphosphate hydrolase protein [Mycena vulgaris]|nr:P-loop containing nucleoside triphosphate hydrolase protein [Mycena vulgaris]